MTNFTRKAGYECPGLPDAATDRIPQLYFAGPLDETFPARRMIAKFALYRKDIPDRIRPQGPKARIRERAAYRPGERIQIDRLKSVSSHLERANVS
jgi:hypothetical protein